MKSRDNQESRDNHRGEGEEGEHITVLPPGVRDECYQSCVAIFDIEKPGTDFTNIRKPETFSLANVFRSPLCTFPSWPLLFLSLLLFFDITKQYESALSSLFVYL